MARRECCHQHKESKYCPDCGERNWGEKEERREEEADDG